MMRRWSFCCFLATFAPPARVVISFPTAPPIPRRVGRATAATTTTATNSRHVPTARDGDNYSRCRPPGLGSLPPSLEALVGDALEKDRKVVVVTGGVLSGIGKGVTASSIGVVSSRNYYYGCKHYAHPTLRWVF